MTRPADTAGRTALALALAVFLLVVLTGGGRIVGSDEVTMFELSRAMLHGRIDVPEGATLKGPDGRYYSKNAAGQAVLALPLVALAEGASGGVPPARRALAARFVASFWNAAVVALLLALFYLGARRLGNGARSALAAAVLLGFSTPLWVYAKSYMAEPLQALGLLLALTGAARGAAGERRATRVAALGCLLAISAKLSMLPLALACLLPLARSPRLWLWPALSVAAALAGHVAYDFARFGSAFETGYGTQATPAAYSTPLAVGLYGLLLSSGKGVLWFAPALWLAPLGLAAMTRAGAHRADAPERRRALALAGRGVIVVWAGGLLLYATFEHWAGDGSWGPRYLVPLLPLAFLGVAAALEGASRARRRVAWALALAGLVVQTGGVAIYFGAQMREAGDYPYTLPLDHPRSMSDSHFNPAFSPIGDHWRMLTRNAGEHLRGAAPRIAGGGEADARLGIGPDDQRRLLHALDFWWTYMAYAGVSSRAIAAALSVLLAALAGALLLLRRAFRAEARAG